MTNDLEMGVIQIAVNEKETVTIRVPEHIEAAYQILIDHSLTELERFSGVLDALGINSIRFKKQLRNIEIRKEYYNIIDSLWGNGGQRPKKALIQQQLCEKYELQSRQLRKILKK